MADAARPWGRRQGRRDRDVERGTVEMADKDLKRRGTEDRVKGTMKELEGRVRSAGANLTNKPGQDVKGKAQQLEGKVRKHIGKAEQDLGDGLV